MIELSLARARELLAEAVAERGEDYVYATPEGKAATLQQDTVCLYVHDRDAEGNSTDPTPGCIAGLVLHKAGVPLEALRRHEHDNAASVVGQLDTERVMTAETGVATLLAAAQEAQDDGRPWGEAGRKGLAELDAYLARL